MDVTPENIVVISNTTSFLPAITVTLLDFLGQNTKAASQLVDVYLNGTQGNPLGSVVIQAATKGTFAAGSLLLQAPKAGYHTLKFVTTVSHNFQSVYVINLTLMRLAKQMLLHMRLFKSFQVMYFPMLESLLIRKGPGFQLALQARDFNFSAAPIISLGEITIDILGIHIVLFAYVVKRWR